MTPPEVRVYLTRLGERLRRILDVDLLGLYVGGSIAQDAYIPGRSDINAAAVSRADLALVDKEAIIAKLRHESLPCPARGLELVVYPERTVGVPSARPGYVLELRTGSGLPLRISLDPADANGRCRHVVNRAVLARHGMTVIGPTPATLIADVPRELVLPALVDFVCQDTCDPTGVADAVLDACRALRYATDGRWSSKPDAGRWALDRLSDAELIGSALRTYETGKHLDSVRVAAFLEQTARRLAGG